MYVGAILNHTSYFFVIGLDEELQTPVVAVENVAQGLINRGIAALSLFLDARVADCTVTVGIEMRAQVSATHSTL